MISKKKNLILFIAQIKPNELPVICTTYNVSLNKPERALKCSKTSNLKHHCQLENVFNFAIILRVTIYSSTQDKNIRLVLF